MFLPSCLNEIFDFWSIRLYNTSVGLILTQGDYNKEFMVYTVNIDDIASRSIVDYMKDNKFEFAEVKDTVFGPLPDETLTLYEMPSRRLSIRDVT